MNKCETNKPTCICIYCITNVIEKTFPSQNKTIKEVLIDKNLISIEEIDELLDIEKLI